MIGGGFGGLSAALHLAEAGADVVLCEALAYPGGCASTFSKGGARFDAGATMFAGFGPGQWMRGWLDRFDLPVRVDLLDPVARFRSDEGELVVPPEREAFAELVAARAGPRADAVRRWFARQGRVADALWALFDAPERLPPLSLGALAHHARRLPAYAPVLPLLGRPLAHALAREGVADVPALRHWLDAVCQITVQVPAAEAEGPFAIAAADYFFRGVAHVDGGIGALADAVVGAIRRRGGEVRLASRVQALRREGEGWRVETRTGAILARRVVANLLPQDLAALLGHAPAPLPRLSRAVEGGWGAAMLFLRVADAGLPPAAFHLQCVADPRAPLPGGNHVLVSVAEARADRAPPGERAVTVSTHVDPRAFDDPAAIDVIHAAMRRTVALRAPELRVVGERTASPRTFARFTRRHRGFVGGVPRRAGWRNYRDLLPLRPAPGLWLVGDTAFPGQSVLAVAIGGHRVAAAAARSLGLRAR